MGRTPFLSPNQQCQSSDLNHWKSPTRLILSLRTTGLLREEALLFDATILHQHWNQFVSTCRSSASRLSSSQQDDARRLNTMWQVVHQSRRQSTDGLLTVEYCLSTWHAHTPAVLQSCSTAGKRVSISIKFAHNCYYCTAFSAPYVTHRRQIAGTCYGIVYE